MKLLTIHPFLKKADTMFIRPNEFERNFPNQPDRNTGPRQLGDITDQVVINTGKRAIARYLAAGDYASANGILKSMNASWAEVIGADDGERAA